MASTRAKNFSQDLSQAHAPGAAEPSGGAEPRLSTAALRALGTEHREHLEGIREAVGQWRKRFRPLSAGVALARDRRFQFAHVWQFQQVFALAMGRVVEMDVVNKNLLEYSNRFGEGVAGGEQGVVGSTSVLPIMGFLAHKAVASPEWIVLQYLCAVFAENGLGRDAGTIDDWPGWISSTSTDKKIMNDALSKHGVLMVGNGIRIRKPPPAPVFAASAPTPAARPPSPHPRKASDKNVSLFPLFQQPKTIPTLQHLLTNTRETLPRLHRDWARVFRERSLVTLRFATVDQFARTLRTATSIVELTRAITRMFLQAQQAHPHPPPPYPYHYDYDEDYHDDYDHYDYQAQVMSNQRFAKWVKKISAALRKLYVDGFKDPRCTATGSCSLEVITSFVRILLKRCDIAIEPSLAFGLRQSLVT